MVGNCNGNSAWGVIGRSVPTRYFTKFLDIAFQEQAVMHRVGETAHAFFTGTAVAAVPVTNGFD